VGVWGCSNRLFGSSTAVAPGSCDLHIPTGLLVVRVVIEPQLPDTTVRSVLLALDTTRHVLLPQCSVRLESYGAPHT
jgi:hypothetical protein